MTCTQLALTQIRRQPTQRAEPREARGEHPTLDLEGSADSPPFGHTGIRRRPVRLAPLGRDGAFSGPEAGFCAQVFKIDHWFFL